MIYPIANIEEFRYFININKDKIKFLWDTFKKNNCKILELDVNFEFNDLALSFNDFQYIMPHSFNKILFNPDEYQYNCELIRSKCQQYTQYVWKTRIAIIS